MRSTPPWLLPALASTPALGWLAWRVACDWFLCDDAYISFRYARNLLEGRGLVFNPGEWVEGYTNFLWVLEVAALWGATGLDPASVACLLSVLCTVGTVAVTAAWAWRTDEDDRRFVLFAALVLLCTERSFAVWATSGLETRQFTLLLAAGLALLADPRSSLARLGRPALPPVAAASLCFGLAALTRPEAWLVFAIAAGCRIVDGLRARDLRELPALLAPFGGLFAGHLALRLYLYGEVVPNTYVAKSVPPMVDVGLQYLLAGSLEAGLYLVAPLAVVGFAARLIRSGALSEAAGPLAIAAYLPFLVRLGGDHFEWRAMDWWWPILFVGAARGLATVARGRRVVAAALLAGVLAYGRAIEVSHDRIVDDHVARGVAVPVHVELGEGSVASWLPLSSWLLPAYDRAMATALRHRSAERHAGHRAFVIAQVAGYGPYLELRDELDLPPDAVARQAAIGVAPFHLPDLVVIDTLGLTDETVARNPVSPKRERHVAHERRPPPGYLEQRGVNLKVQPAARSPAEGLETASHVVMVGSVGFVFESHVEGWAESAFAGRPLWSRSLDPRAPSGNRLVTDAGRWRGAALLGSFEAGLDAWVPEGGEAFAPTPGSGPAPKRITGQVGRGCLDSSRAAGDEATGVSKSPRFVIPPDAVLALLVGGSAGPDAGVRLVVDGQAVATLHGRGTDELRYRWIHLEAYAGREASIEVFDHAAGGHVLVDQVVVLVKD